MRAASPLALGAALSACGAAAARQPSTTPTASNQAIAKLQSEAEAQSTRIAELEARLALLEADSRQWRETSAAPAPQRSTETVRISAAQRRERQGSADDDVPLVRLHEDAAPEATVAITDTAPLSLPPRPAGVSARLPVVPLPEAHSGKLLSNTAADGTDADARERYRLALRSVREGHFDAAGDALSAFLDVYPAHALSAGATYWLGEVRYAQRRYGEALQEFKAVLTVFPDSDKRAGSLLKAGLCQKRLGDEGAARRYFEQLREQFPNSDAARVASREGSS